MRGSRDVWLVVDVGVGLRRTVGYGDMGRDGAVASRPAGSSCMVGHASSERQLLPLDSAGPAVVADQVQTWQ